MKKFILNFRLLLGTYISSNTKVFFILLRIFGHRKKGRSAITDKTKIVIDGFPRSANTFAYNAFLIAQKDKIQNDHIAHHIHKSGQIIKAINLGIPVVLLIRNPKDAVLSLKIRQPAYSLKTLLKVYILFHKPLLKRKNAIVVAQFDKVTADFDGVIKNVNKKFNCSFETYDQSLEGDVFNKIRNAQDVKSGENPEERVSIPTEEKKLKKKQLENEISLYSKLLKEAEFIYNQMIG